MATEAAEAAFEAASRSGELAKAGAEGDAAFQSVLDDMKGKGIDTSFISRSSDGKVTFNYNSKAVPIEDLNGKYYDFETGKAPDFASILKDMGFKPEEINSPEMKSFIDSSTKKFNTDWKKYQGMKEIEKGQKAVADEHPPPKTPEEFQQKGGAKLEKTAQKSWSDLAKSGAEGAGKLGKWVVETAGKLAPYAIAGVVLYNLVKQHQDACNGCWKIEKANPNNKCKISNLTCNSDARNTSHTDDYQFCTECDSNSEKMCEGNSSILFNPCIIDDKGGYYTSCTDAEKQGDTGHTLCDTNGNHMGPGNSGQFCSNKVKDPSDDTTNCPPSDWCSKNCDCAKSENCEGAYFLQCVNYNFWGAFSDYFGTPIGDISKLLGDVGGTILNILKYVAIGIVILISILVVFEIIRFFINRRHNEGGEQVYQLPPPPPPTTYPVKNTGNPFDEFK